MALPKSPIVLIPARLAATRLPDKVLAEIGGVPMIVQVWRRASEAEIGPVVVACDDERIATAVREAGGQAVLTRPDHPSGSDRIHEALLTLDPEGRHDAVVNVQGDLPTIEPRAIAMALTPLADTAVDIATLVAEIRGDEERIDPNVVKAAARFAEGESSGRVRSFCRSLDAPHCVVDGMLLFHHIGLYVYRRPALERFVALPRSPLEARERLEQLRALEAGMRIDAALVDTVPLGVDTPADLARAREILGSAG